MDKKLLYAVIILLAIGIAVLASVSAVFSQENVGSPTYYLFHQLRSIGLGLVLGFIAFKMKIKTLKKQALKIVLLAFGLMIIVFIPFVGVQSGGASRWINIFGQATFQPSEFLKLAFIIYLSAWLVSASKKTKIFKFFGKVSEIIPFLLVLIAITVLLILQSDLSTLILIIAVAILLYFAAGTPLWHTATMFIIFASLIFVAIKWAPYRMKRVLVYLDPDMDPMGIGYQIKQILIAIGSGGIFGLGAGMSSQKFGFIPQTMADSIFAIFAEEFGFIGSFILVLLFLYITWRGFRIAKHTNDKFSQLLALGVSSWICIQAFINIAAMLRIIPLTGIPLPFISYGGSHIIMELIGVGFLLNISKK